MVEVLVPISVFVMFAVMLGLITRLLATASLNRTIREAMRNDPSSVPILAARLGQHSPWGDALLGWIILAVGLAMVLYGLTEADAQVRSGLFRGSIFPFVVGLAIVAYARFTTRGTPKS